LANIVENWKPDCIHAFDARSHILASIVSIQRQVAVNCTLCGGIAPYYNIPLLGKIIVFSPEQKEKLIKVFGWKERNIEIINSRLDMEQFDRTQEDEVDRLYREHGININDKNIMMITNFLGPKVEAIQQVLEVIRGILPKYAEARLIIIGGGGDFFQKAQEIKKSINVKCGREGVVFTGPIMNAHKFLAKSYMVLGVGRSAFEGMAYRKPTLIVGEKGFAGTVSEKTIKEISYYNFSGRNNRDMKKPQDLAMEIERLLVDKDYYESARNFGIEFLRRFIDIKAGIERIEEVYRANTIFAGTTSRIYRVLNMIRVLTPIIFDNYYNQVKSKLLPVTMG
jgi:glycosyltransferase involved in cell wall biosynthesis